MLSTLFLFLHALHGLNVSIPPLSPSRPTNAGHSRDLVEARVLRLWEATPLSHRLHDIVRITPQVDAGVLVAVTRAATGACMYREQVSSATPSVGPVSSYLEEVADAVARI